MQVSQVSAAELAAEWPLLSPLVQRGLTEAGHGEFTLADMYAAFLAGAFQLWVAHEIDGPHAVIVTQIVVYPQSKSALVIVCAGRRVNEWQDLFLEQFEKWARLNGCKSAEIVGRDGWVRRLANQGWRKDAVLLRKDFDESVVPFPTRT